MEQEENIYKGPRYNEEKAEKYYLQADKYYQEGNYKEGNRLLMIAIEHGYSKDVFKEKYVMENTVLDNKCLNNLLIATFGLQKDFDELVSEMCKGKAKY